MKNKDLIAELSKLDGEAEVVFHWEEGGISSTITSIDFNTKEIEVEVNIN